MAVHTNARIKTQRIGALNLRVKTVLIDANELKKILRERSDPQMERLCSAIAKKAVDLASVGGGTPHVSSPKTGGVIPNTGLPPHANIGTLRDEIRFAKSSFGAWLIGVTKKVEYAEYVEFGTHRMVARPYLGPAMMAYGIRLNV